jgi:hypothetical protein
MLTGSGSFHHKEGLMRKRLSVLIACFSLMASVAGCVHTLATPQQIAQADYGTLGSSYKDAIQNSMQTVLFDPESARYRYLGTPVRGCAIVAIGGQPVFGYLVEVNINAKNRLGGYVGEDTFTFLVRNDEVWRLSYFTPKQVTP